MVKNQSEKMCEVENYCYNLGCGKKFKDAANHAKACTFHSGKPYFHDAYKVSHHWEIVRAAVVMWGLRDLIFKC